LFKLYILPALAGINVIYFNWTNTGYCLHSAGAHE